MRATRKFTVPVGALAVQRTPTPAAGATASGGHAGETGPDPGGWIGKTVRSVYPGGVVETVKRSEVFCPRAIRYPPGGVE